MHPAIFLVAAASDSSQGSDLKIALISAAAVVLAASIPAALSMRERVPREVRQLRQSNAVVMARLEAELHDTRQDRDRFEAERDAMEQDKHRLERFLWLLGYDPETLQHVPREDAPHGGPATAPEPPQVGHGPDPGAGGSSGIPGGV